jgi:hypothetical protein
VFCDHTRRPSAFNHDLMARGPPVHWLAVGPYTILMIVIAPWIRAYQGENYFGITGALTPCCRRAPNVSPTSRTGGQGVDP